MANATPPAMQMNVTTEIRRLQKVVDDLEGMLRQHQQILRQKAMSLPQGFLPELQKLRTDLDNIAKSLDEAQTEVVRLRSLSDTAELINSTLDLNDVLNAVMDTVIRLTGAERGYLMLRNEETKELEFTVARNIEQRSLEEGEFIVSRTIVGDVANSGNPVVTTNAAQDARFSSQESVVSFALRSILCVPLIVKGQVTGVIYADNRIRAGLFGPKELSLLFAFANQAAVAIENARLYESVRASLAEITAINALMDNVFASIASGVITTDAEDTVLILNEAACKILSVAREISQGKVVWDILPLVNDANFTQIMDEVRQQQREYTVEIEPEIVSRGLVNLNLKLSPLLDTRQVSQGMTIVVDDLTEVKRREEQLSLVRVYLPPAMVDNISTIDNLGLGGERRLVTTIFIDVRGFGTFPATLRPQEFMEMLNVYLTIASDAVTQQNGVIDKYMANEIMGLFNTQLNPDEDHAWRAVSAALNMADEYQQFYQMTGEPEGVQHFRVGIHTGVATLGNAGSQTRREFTAIGDAINLAHRILENAKPGQIIISQDTYNYCQAAWADPQNGLSVESLGAIQVKGREKPVSVYHVWRQPQAVASS